jgi:phage terminase large subunit-like protein
MRRGLDLTVIDASTLPPGAAFDDVKAEKALAFFGNLRQIQGQWADEKMALLAWQKELIARIFGVVRADGRRQYRTVYVEIPRKNGKSTLAAGLALYLLCADGEQGAQVYSAAADREQANIVFDTAAEMVRRTPALRQGINVLASYNVKRLVYAKTGSFYRSIPADAHGAHGFNASGVILDEAHTQPNRELFDVLTTSVGARRQPLIFVITTAGYDRASLCWELHEYARQVRDGVIDDPTFLPVLYGAGEADDWTSPAVWAAANPSLGVTVTAEFLGEECAKATNLPAYENTFRRLYLNQWTGQAERVIPMDAWDRCGGEVGEGALLGQVCWAGLDLSSTTDISALCLLFRDGEAYRALLRFWLPEATARAAEKRDAAPYLTWAHQGHLRLTPGNVIDYAFIREEINALARRYEIAELAYDPWNATQLVLNLQEDGANCVPVRQGFASMSAPTKALLALVLAGRLAHGGHPVLRWMADNLAVAGDPAGNIKPDKAKSTRRIDGVVALVMALDRASRDEGASYLEHEELLVL